MLEFKFTILSMKKLCHNQLMKTKKNYIKYKSIHNEKLKSIISRVYLLYLSGCYNINIIKRVR